MSDVLRRLKLLEEAMVWRDQWKPRFGDPRDRVSIRLWSDGTGMVVLQEQVLFVFDDLPDFDRKAEELTLKNRWKSALERVDWGSCA